VETENEEKYLIFSVFDRQYAFPSRLIGEITLFDAVYPLPLVPAFVLGVINRYSVPYALFDTGLLLLKTHGLHNKVLIIKEEIDRIAFLIDDVTGIADVPRENLFSVEQNADSGDLAEAISATFKHNNEDVFVLDIQRILARAFEEAA
jgi:purine-binding chemotaxis protein CheW